MPKYIVENFSTHDRRSVECETLDDAREEARRRLGVVALDPALKGGCPDDEDNGLAGVECWLRKLTDNEAADAAAAVYILRHAK